MHNQNNAGAVLRAAAALANIAKGAATGGLYGAAIGAVKSFLPEIVRAAAILIAILILLPVLVFSALPNILFGFDNARAADVAALTGKAYSIDAAYREVQNYNREEINRIVAAVMEAYTSEEDGPAFDDVEVTEDMDNTSIYWFIAITSVAHEQNLFTMDESSIKSMTVGKIVHTSALLSTLIGEGEDAAIMRTLKIDIQDLDPYALMDKLRFSEEERSWAHVLYAALAEDQYVGITDSDGEGYYNTDYGSVVFTDAATEVVYYNQTDSRWGNLMYGKTGTIGAAGCGPTALAIVVASLTGQAVTPKDTAKWSVDTGHRCEWNGSYHSLIPDGARHYGLAVEGATAKDAQKIADALADGKLVVAIMSRGHFTNGGHFIILRGVTADGNILVADPASVKRSNQEWSLSLILNEASRKAGAGGPFWIIGL